MAKRTKSRRPTESSSKANDEWTEIAREFWSQRARETGAERGAQAKRWFERVFRGAIDRILTASKDRHDSSAIEVDWRSLTDRDAIRRFHADPSAHAEEAVGTGDYGRGFMDVFAKKLTKVHDAWLREVARRLDVAERTARRYIYAVQLSGIDIVVRRPPGAHGTCTYRMDRRSWHGLLSLPRD